MADFPKWLATVRDSRHRERVERAQNSDSSRHFLTDSTVHNGVLQSEWNPPNTGTKNRFTQLVDVFFTNPSTNSLFTTSDISMWIFESLRPISRKKVATLTKIATASDVTDIVIRFRFPHPLCCLLSQKEWLTTLYYQVMHLNRLQIEWGFLWYPICAAFPYVGKVSKRCIVGSHCCYDALPCLSMDTFLFFVSFLIFVSFQLLCYSF